MSVFDDELIHLKELILRMGGQVELAIKNSIAALVERDNNLAKTVIEDDAKINALDIIIDEEAIKLIALRQPKAGDLRLITTAMKITTDLERMGDQAVNISRRALELNMEPVLKPYIDIPKMAVIAQQMTKDALDAFIRKDRDLSLAVIARDDEVDGLKRLIVKELATYMSKDPSTITRGMKVSFVAVNLERIADHATNIAEMVIFLVEGRIIRHMDIKEACEQKERTILPDK
jgi:phosphate transport system protein